MMKALDHVALVVGDLDAAVSAYEALLGRSPNWRGADGGAAHAWFQLSNMALDVIAATGPGYTGDRVKAQLDAEGEGIWALAFTVDDMGKTRHRLERVGVPAHPGSLLWLGRLGRVPVVGMPSCGLFSRATVFDLVLPRLLAGLPVDSQWLASLGMGGLLTRDVAARFPPYRPRQERGAVD